MDDSQSGGGSVKPIKFFESSDPAKSGNYLLAAGKYRITLVGGGGYGDTNFAYLAWLYNDYGATGGGSAAVIQHTLTLTKRTNVNLTIANATEDTKLIFDDGSWVAGGGESASGTTSGRGGIATIDGGTPPDGTYVNGNDGTANKTEASTYGPVSVDGVGYTIPTLEYGGGCGALRGWNEGANINYNNHVVVGYIKIERI